MTPSPLRWRMISLAFWATIINYLDRQTLSVAAPALREQFHMSNVDYSRVLFAFLLAYTIMNGGNLQEPSRGSLNPFGAVLLVGRRHAVALV